MLKKLKSKKVIIVSIMIMLTSVLMLSYASFVVTTNDYKASELLVSELTYSLTIYDENNNQVENPMTIGANQTKIYNAVIRSINKIDSKYTLAYNSQNNLTVKYSNRTSWSTEDYIKDYNSNNTKEVRIVVENKSSEERNVEIKIFGGYRYNKYSDINIGDYTRITEEYNEMLASTSETLEEIIKEETKCESESCLYGGGSKSNYLSYSNNLYRIIGTYTIGTDKVTKIISENITETSNIKEDLTTIYNSLEEKEEIIYKTNKFNCSEYACTEVTDYNNIGLLTKYEYELVGGENSYLKSNEGYYILNESNIETQNGSNEGGLKPVIYLPNRTRVTGSGTISDPYKILTSDINIIAYTYNGKETDIPYETLKTSKIVDSIECEKGSTATWNYETNSINILNTNIPEYCTVNFIDGYKVTVNVEGGSVEGYNTVGIETGKNVLFTIKPYTNYKLESIYVSCEEGNYNDAGTLTISNVTSDKICTIILAQSKITFKMKSKSCTDNVNTNASPCYIIKNNSTTVTYEGKIYTGCTISSSIMKRGGSCQLDFTDTSYMFWHSDNDGWYFNDGNLEYSQRVSCSVVLTCDL